MHCVTILCPGAAAAQRPAQAWRMLLCASGGALPALPPWYRPLCWTQAVLAQPTRREAYERALADECHAALEPTGQIVPWQEKVCPGHPAEDACHSPCYVAC